MRPEVLGGPSSLRGAITPAAAWLALWTPDTHVARSRACGSFHGRADDVSSIRSASTFLDFFAKNGHEVVPSSPLVPRNDPTLMFTNAGMVQFKNVFTGQETRPYTRATSSQKCVRAGGKHNDLDNVGYTAGTTPSSRCSATSPSATTSRSRRSRWPGSWSPRTSALDPKRLLVTIYHDDEDAYRHLEEGGGLLRRQDHPHRDHRQLLVDGRHRPVRAVLGDLLRPGRQGRWRPAGQRRRRTATASWSSGTSCSCSSSSAAPATASTLPKPSIDTGMGLERMTAVLQGVHVHYDIDLFKALIAASVAATGVPAKGEHQASHRVIADHLRATSFLIADGVLPSNDGRGYVLRRIMRRAMRHAHLLGAKEPLMYRLVPALVQQMGETYQELVRGAAADHRDAQARGDALPQDAGAGPRPARRSERRAEEGRRVRRRDRASSSTTPTAFPLDLTQDALKPRGIAVDTAGFDAAMEKQKAEARKAWKGSGEAATETVWFEVKEQRRRHGVPRLRHRDGRGRDPRHRQGRQGGRKASRPATRPRSCSTRRRSTASPAARSATRASSRAPRARCSASPTRRRSSATCSCISAASRRARSRSGDARRAQRRSRAPHGHARQPLGDPPPARGAAPGARHARGAEGLAGRAGSAALRLLAHQADDARRDGGGRGPGQRLRAAERAGRDAADGARGCDGDGRHGAVRREVRRRGARRLDGRRPKVRTAQGQQGLVGRAVRRHARGAHRRHRPRQDHRRERQRGRRAAHRGADRRRRARLSGRAGSRACASWPACCAPSPRTWSSASRRCWRSASSSSASSPTPSGSSRSAAGPAPATARRRRGRRRAHASARSSCWRAPVQGLNPKDLRGLIDDGKKQVGSGIVAIVGVTEDGKAGLAVGVTEDLTATHQRRRSRARPARRRSAARAAAAGPTWRRPAGRTARRRKPR